MLHISLFSKLIQPKDFIVGIHHYITVVGKRIFDSNITFALPLNCENLDYFYTNDNETKVINGYKGVLKSIMFCLTETKICALFRNKNLLLLLLLYKDVI